MLRSQLVLVTTILALATACSEPSPPAVEESPEPVLIQTSVSENGTVEAPDGLPIVYSTRGSGSPALVFLHCWGCDRSFWRNEVGPLSADHRVVTLDLGGHGESGKEREHWTLEGLAQDAVTVIEALGLDDVIVVGHSMGAPVAIFTAEQLPDVVHGVILVDSLHDVEQRIDPAVWTKLMTAYRSDYAGTCHQMVVALFPKDADPSLMQQVETDMCAGPQEVGLALLDAFPGFDAARELEKLKVPVRAINAGDRPTSLEKNRQHAADYDAVIMEGVGHFPMLEKPDEFNRLLRQAVESIESAPAPTGP